jgi:hypothetical protein
VEYDLPTENEARRVYFYQKLHRKFISAFKKPLEFSSQSCYLSEDEDAAKLFYSIAKEFCTRATMYRAQELERYGKRGK